MPDESRLTSQEGWGRGVEVAVPISLLACLSVHLSACLPAWLLQSYSVFFLLSVCVCLSVCLSVCICLSACLSVCLYLSVCLSGCTSVLPSVCLSVCRVPHACPACSSMVGVSGCSVDRLPVG